MALVSYFAPSLVLVVYISTPLSLTGRYGCRVAEQTEKWLHVGGTGRKGCRVADHAEFQGSGRGKRRLQGGRTGRKGCRVAGQAR